MLPRMLIAAVDEGVEVAAWYAKEQISLANDFVAALAQRLEEIQHSPRRFALLETVETNREIRRAQLSRFPYLVVYEIFSNEPIVLAIMHTSRDPGYWLKRNQDS